MIIKLVPGLKIFEFSQNFCNFLQVFCSVQSTLQYSLWYTVAMSEDLFTYDYLNTLNIPELSALVKNMLAIPRDSWTSKQLFIEFILNNATPDLQISIRDAIAAKASKKSEDQCQRHAEQKRKWNDTQNIWQRTAAQVEAEIDEVHNISKFLELPEKARVKECYCQFYNATSNTAVCLVVCAICACEVNMWSDGVTECHLSSLPNSQCLIPKHAHPAHDLYSGRLLEPQGIVRSGDGGPVMRVCKDCLGELKDKSKKPPTYSLANNLWIRCIPWQLQVLTFSEQLLIALLYPRVYVFKLYPKDIDFHPDGSILQCGMWGNVSTYDLDMKGAALMIQGNLMPWPALILPSVISVTFIGWGSAPKQSLRSIFWVHRQVIFEALCWLKANNHKYYSNIEIDPEHLHRLPEDDVPIEILSVIHQSNDTRLIDQESTGYVPMDGDETDSKWVVNEIWGPYLTYFQSSGTEGRAPDLLSEGDKEADGGGNWKTLVMISTSC